LDTHVVYGVICKICQTVNLIIKILIWIDEAFMQVAGTPKLKQFALYTCKKGQRGNLEVTSSTRSNKYESYAI